VTHATEWARRAEALYTSAYARKYRVHDDELRGVETYRAFCAWLTSVCRRFDRTIDVLDLGCGTGRYFAALTGVGELVGLDASAAMLEEAAHPVDAGHITARAIRLVRGDLLTQVFPDESFDLVYSIGVLAEHTPLDGRVVANVSGWLRGGGRFAFTTVHPDSWSVRRTFRRTVGRAMLPLMSGGLRRSLRRRIVADGRYADETWIRECVGPRLTIESLERLDSEAHLHCLCVAQKTGQEGQEGQEGREGQEGQEREHAW
jgi:SAM-dependent methyltransferase